MSGLPAEVGPMGAVPLVATIGTLESGSVIATVTNIATIGTIVADVSVLGSVVLQGGTVGTVLSLQGVTISSVTAVSYFAGTFSATIKGSPGLYWGVKITNPTTGVLGSVAGTIVLYNWGIAAAAQGGAGPASTIIAIIQAGPKTTAESFLFRPLPFNTLVASLIGSVSHFRVDYE